MCYCHKGSLSQIVIVKNCHCQKMLLTACFMMTDMSLGIVFIRLVHTSGSLACTRYMVYIYCSDIQGIE